MPTKKKLTISDIANLAGVSPASVSRVINGLPGVKPSIRKSIHSIIEETGYQPSTLASGLSRGKIKIIGLILGDIRNPFYADVTYYVQKQLQKYGFSTMLFSSEYDASKELEYISLANRLRFSGIIMISALNSEELNSAIENLSCPVVLLNRTIEKYQGCTVVMNNLRAGYILTEHLIELGHTSIAFLTGPLNSVASSNRVIGFRQALADHGIEINEEFVSVGDLKQDTGFKYGTQIIQRLDTFASAIICGNDSMAIGFLDACQSNGIKVPEDISVAGFDDISVSRLQCINLTTIRQPTEAMATRAVDLILYKINNPEGINQHVMLEPELIVRNSTMAIGGLSS